MKRIFLVIFFPALSLPLWAQNQTTVSGSKVTDLNQQLLATGQICFLGTDQSDNPISFQQGGGGQVLRRAFCSAVTAGVITSFTVPNPANTLPSGIYYRVTVKDTSSGLEVLRYTGVTFAGGTFNFDGYTPVLSGASFAPLTGTSVTGNLGVTGNISATGTIIGSNIPANILQQIFNQGVGLTQRTSFNCLAGIVCSDNVGTLKTDVRLGTLTTVTFSATPTFDASTASTFKITLTGNVTSSTLSNAVAGQPIAIEICQDGTGGRTFVAPTNVLGFVTIPSSASACILETFVYDGSNALADQDVASQLKGPEAAAPTGVANFDLLYADSTAHRWKMINNNGTAAQVVGSGADINTSDQVTVTHLASALPEVQGGTNQSSYTLGDTLYSSAANTLSKLAGNTTTTKKYLQQQGNGSVSAAPSWQQIAPADIAAGTYSSATLASPTVTGTASGNGTLPTAMLASTPGILSFWCTGTATANTTLVLTGSTCTATTGYLIPVNAGTVKNLFCKAVNAGVNASSGLVTVRKNVISQSMTCTIGTGISCNDQTHTFSVSAGDSIDIIFTTQIGETLSALACSVEKI